MSAATPRFGFAGLGVMGVPMSRHLLAAGPLIVWNRTQSRADGRGEDGARRAQTPAEVLDGADSVGVCVLDGAAVREIALGENGFVAAGDKAGKVVVDFSSIAPEDAREIAEELATHGVGWIDAPVSGGVTGADKATLSIMVGCSDEDALAKVMPTFEATGKNIFRCGPLGAGHAMKCLNNYLSAVGLTASNEALLIGPQCGLEPSAMVDILTVSPARTRSLARRRRPSGWCAHAFTMALARVRERRGILI